MSGICADYRFDEMPVERGSLDAMLDALRDWGERPSAWLSGGRVGLACRQRAVTPEDASDDQPLVSTDGVFVLVADARIDNRDELAARLGMNAGEAKRLPDSAFILAAYRAWGDDCARRLVGDFAFVLWDARRQSLYCARDPVGLRVLFYHCDDRRLTLASSIPALLASGCVQARLNEQKIAELLVLLEDAETTCFAGVRRIPGGHTLIATPAGMRLRRYWNPDPGRRLKLRSDEQYLEAFDEVFGRAVRDRLRSSRPVGVMLSAGLDSTAVAAVAADALRREGSRLVAFHSAPGEGRDVAGRPGWVMDESSDVRAFVDMHDNVDLRIVRESPKTLLELAVPSFRAIGAPIRNTTNLGWVATIYDRAARRGAGIMLNGGNGNLTISYTGLLSIRDSARAGRLVTALREARAVAAMRGHRPFDVVKDEILRPLMPPSALRALRRLRRRRPTPVQEASLSAIRPEFAAAARLEDVLEARRLDQASLDDASAAEYRLRILGSGGDGLDVYHSMRSWFPVETRTPTTDVRVIEFCVSLPGSQYLSRGQDRLLVRRGMRGRVPESILQRRTRGAQAADWPYLLEQMRPAMATELARIEQNETARRCLDTERMRNLIENWPARFGPEHVEDYDMMLLRGIMMGRYIRWFEETWS